MNFTDPQLQDCYDRNFAAMRDYSDERRQVRALIAAHDLFRLMEGPHSPRVHETIQQLLLPELRSELRRWYQHCDADPNAAARYLRDQLSLLAGEELEKATDISHNPS